MRVKQFPHMHEIAQEKGYEFLANLLDQKVVINVKVDQVAFVVKKIGEEIQFFGRDGKQPINIIKRATNNLYEDAITHVNKMSWDWLPDGIEVYLEYFTDKLEMSTHYNKRPRNGLIVSYVKYNGAVLSPDKPLVSEISLTFQVSPPPILFNGFLNEYQKNALLNYVKLPQEERQNNFSKQNFVKFLTNIFDHPEDLRWLYEGGYEGLILYFGHGLTRAKLVDPMFGIEKMQEKDSQYTGYEKTVDRLLLSTISAVFDKTLEDFRPKHFPEQDYINFVSSLAFDLIVKYGTIFDAQLAPFNRYRATRRGAGLTYEFLPKVIKELTIKYWWAEDVVIQLLQLLRTKRANARIALSEHGTVSKDWKIFLDYAIEKMAKRGVQGS